MLKGFLPELTLAVANASGVTVSETESPRQTANSPVRHTLRFSIKNRMRALIAGLLVLATVGGLTGFIVTGGQRSASPKVHAYPVNVATAQISQVPIELKTIGNVTPYSVVNITPQVSGQLVKVAFTQGQVVKKGDLLFQIDPRPYQAAVDQASGNVAKDKAQIEAAQANLQKDTAQVGLVQANLKKDQAQQKYANTEQGRYTELVNEGAVSKEQADQMTNNASQAQATVQADQKAIDNAKAVVQADKAQIDTAKGTLSADKGTLENANIQLGWTQIHAPIDGRTSSLNVYQGNNVAASSGASTTQPLVSIDQVSPTYVQMTVPEQYLDNVRRSLQDGTLKLEAQIEGQKAEAVDGTISFLQNAVDTTNGTVMMRASFSNGDGRLYPGQFVDVIISMPPAGNSVVVPARAIQTTQQGTSVWVVNQNGTVALVPVQVGQTQGDRSAITSGITAGQEVVTDGQMNLVPGAAVKVEQTQTNMSRASS